MRSLWRQTIFSRARLCRDAGSDNVQVVFVGRPDDSGGSGGLQPVRSHYITLSWGAWHVAQAGRGGTTGGHEGPTYGREGRGEVMGTVSFSGNPPRRPSSSMPTNEQTTYTSSAIGVSNKFTSYAQTNIISIDRDHLELALKDELKKYEARMNTHTLFSVSFSLILAGFGTSGVKLTFWGQDFTVSTLFFAFGIASLVWAIKVGFAQWRTGLKYDFVASVFQLIEQKYAISATSGQIAAMRDIAFAALRSHRR